MWWTGPAVVLLAYAIGSISFALWIGGRYGLDLREEGSGNPGATNVGRVLGKRLGRVVLLLDVAKGAAAAGLAALWLGWQSPWTAAAGAATVAGHCFPLWHGMRGGKGVASSAGVLAVLVPPAGIGAMITYLAAKKLSRRASVGSLFAALVGALVSWIWLGPSPRSYLAIGLLALIVVRHADNLRRLWRGEEEPS